MPDRCTIDLDRRLLPGETWASVRGELEELLASLAREFPDLQPTIGDPYLESQGMEAPVDSAIVRMAEEAVRRIDGGHPIGGVPYCTDAACLAAVGIPRVVLGPGHIEQALRRVPLKRLGSPEDVVRGVLYLIESDFVTGDVLNVDGGQRLL